MLDSKILISQIPLAVLKCEVLFLSQIITITYQYSLDTKDMSTWKAFYEHKQCSSEEEPKCSMTLVCFIGFKQKGIIPFK